MYTRKFKLTPCKFPGYLSLLIFKKAIEVTKLLISLHTVLYIYVGNGYRF